MAKRIIIPARLHSTRLPGKVLIKIAGKPMLEHVYERAVACEFDSVVIATDDEQVAQAARDFGAPVCMTSAAHTSGTDRLAEAVKILGYDDQDVIVNLQGDEPLMPIENIHQVATMLATHKEAAVATLRHTIESIRDALDPNLVKVVADKAGYALYFSRAPIPWHRGIFPDKTPEQLEMFYHVGMYAYRGDFLQHYQELTPCQLEKIEGLEQLRVLYHGFKIIVKEAKANTPPGVDTEVGLAKVRKLLGD